MILKRKIKNLYADLTKKEKRNDVAEAEVAGLSKV